MWLADWFLTCDICGKQEWMDGRLFADAEKTARKRGWSINRRKQICPECKKKDSLSAKD